MCFQCATTHFLTAGTLKSLHVCVNIGCVRVFVRKELGEWGERQVKLFKRQSVFSIQHKRIPFCQNTIQYRGRSLIRMCTGELSASCSLPYPSFPFTACWLKVSQHARLECRLMRGGKMIRKRPTPVAFHHILSYNSSPQPKKPSKASGLKKAFPEEKISLLEPAR